MRPTSYGTRKLRFSLTAFLIFFVSAAFCQLEERFKKDLKGPVKECTESFYQAKVENGKPVPGAYEGKDIGVFDTKGRIIEYKKHYAESPLGVFDKIVLSYDVTGCVKAITFYSPKDEEEYRLTYTCEKGKIVEGKETIYNGTVVQTFFKYDERGFLVRKEGQSIREYKNDAFGRPLIEYVISEDNTRVKLWEYVYNEQGLLSKTTDYVDGLKAAVFLKEYIYDQRGNWITCISYYADPATIFLPERNKRATEVWTRRIVYY